VQTIGTPLAAASITLSEIPAENLVGATNTRASS
jgi:hypothetical protein